MVHAAALYAAALALAPSVADQLRIPGSLAFGNGVNEAFTVLERALVLDPSYAPAHAARANVLVRGGFVDHAREAYTRAAELDPSDAGARYALAELAFLARDEAAAWRWFDEAFARRRLFSPPVPSAARHALVLGLAGPWPRNMPLDFVVDDRQWTLHRWFLPDRDAATRAVPRVDLIINALGESDIGAGAIADASAIVAASDVPVINPPERLAGLARHRLAQTLAGVAGVRVAATARVARGDLTPPTESGVAGIAVPLLMRPIDTHGGRGLERIDDPGQLAGYLERVPGETYDCSAFVDYRSADGWFRKYRIIFIDGVPYPYHLAIDDQWMIHYYRTATTGTPWMNDEEARFLDAPASAIAGWGDAVPAIARACGLDYFGIDCAQLADGTLLVFEADTAMLVHALDASDAGRDKRAAVGRIRTALMDVFARRAAQNGATFATVREP